MKHLNLFVGKTTQSVKVENEGHVAPTITWVFTDGTILYLKIDHIGGDDFIECIEKEGK